MKKYKRFDVCIDIEGMFKKFIVCFIRNHTGWSYLREEFIIFQNIIISIRCERTFHKRLSEQYSLFPTLQYALYAFVQLFTLAQQ